MNVGPSHRSQFLVLTKMNVASSDENEMLQPEVHVQKLVRQVEVLNCGTEATLMVLKIKQWFIKGEAQGKLAGCEDDFMWLV